MTATQTFRVDGAVYSLAIKSPCVAVSSANLTLTGEQTVNSIAVVEEDRVLVKDQTDTTENGIYVVETGAWDRAKDFDGNRDIVDGTLVTVAKTTGMNFFYQVDATDPIVIGTSEIAFLLASDPNVSWPIIQAEIDYGLTTSDINDSYEPGNVLRYGTNSVPGTTNMYSAFEAAFASNKNVYAPGGRYKYDDGGVSYQLTQSLYLFGEDKAGTAADEAATRIEVTQDNAPFYMGGVDSVRLENFYMKCAKHGPRMSDPDTTAANLSGTHFAMIDVHLRGSLDSTQGGDASIETDDLITSGDAAVSAKTITDFDPQKTYEDVDSQHGSGLILTVCLDATISRSVITNFGVGLVNWGADLTNVIESRIASNGISDYDKFLGAGAGGSWGSQLKLKNVETLYNLRAPNLLLDNSTYVEIDNLFYEISGQQGVFIASKAANFKLTDSRHDGVWRSSGTTNATDQPFMLIDAYVEGNLVRDNYYAQYLTGTPKSSPVIRFINTARGNLHKREGFILGPNKTSVFPREDFSDGSNDAYILTFRRGEPSPFLLTPTNVPLGFGAEHSVVLEGAHLVFGDGATTSAFMAAQMLMPRYDGTLTIDVTAKASAGTEIFFTVLLVDNAGRTVKTIKNGNLAGFNTSTYATVSMTYDLDANIPIAVTKIDIGFPTDDGFVASLRAY